MAQRSDTFPSQSLLPDTAKATMNLQSLFGRSPPAKGNTNPHTMGNTHINKRDSNTSLREHNKNVASSDSVQMATRPWNIENKSSSLKIPRFFRKLGQGSSLTRGSIDDAENNQEDQPPATILHEDKDTDAILVHSHSAKSANTPLGTSLPTHLVPAPGSSADVSGRSSSNTSASHADSAPGRTRRQEPNHDGKPPIPNAGNDAETTEGLINVASGPGRGTKEANPPVWYHPGHTQAPSPENVPAPVPATTYVPKVAGGNQGARNNRKQETVRNSGEQPGPIKSSINVASGKSNDLPATVVPAPSDDKGAMDGSVDAKRSDARPQTHQRPMDQHEGRSDVIGPNAHGGNGLEKGKSDAKPDAKPLPGPTPPMPVNMPAVVPPSLMPSESGKEANRHHEGTSLTVELRDPEEKSPTSPLLGDPEVLAEIKKNSFGDAGDGRENQSDPLIQEKLPLSAQSEPPKDSLIKRGLARAGGLLKARRIKDEEIEAEDVVIVVMGPTGAGKSTFISIASALDDKETVQVGHSLKSCTSEIAMYRIWCPLLLDRDIVLVDTPGFDDTNISDADTLRYVSKWLEARYKAHTKLAGILYFHRISDNRMAGTPLKNLRMFQKLCGDDSLKKVTLVTTMWDMVESEDLGDARLEELTGDPRFWKLMIDKGSEIKKFHGDFKSALDVLSRTTDPIKKAHDKALVEELEEGRKLAATTVAPSATGDQRITKTSDIAMRPFRRKGSTGHRSSLSIDAPTKDTALRLQQEIVDEGKELRATEAGQVLFTKLQELVQKRQTVLDRLKEEIELGGKEGIPDSVLTALAKELEDLQKEFDAAHKELVSLKITLGDRLTAWLKAGSSLGGFGKLLKKIWPKRQNDNDRPEHPQRRVKEGLAPAAPPSVGNDTSLNPDSSGVVDDDPSQSQPTEPGLRRPQ